MTDQYDHDRNIIYAHVNTLLNLKPMTSESAESIRKLINEVTDSIESLKALKIPVDQWNCILVPLIVRCLDKISHRDWEQKIAGNCTGEGHIIFRNEGSCKQGR